MATRHSSSTPPSADDAGSPVRRARWGGFLPRSTVGVVALILAAAVGAAFSGTVLFAYYSYQLNQMNGRVSSFINGFDQRYKTATATINADVANGRAQIQNSLQPLLKSEAVGGQMSSLLSKSAPAVWFVHTLDQNGQPSVGSAFVVAADDTKSLMVTSYSTVQAATKSPAPDIFVQKSGTDTKATLWSWDPGNDVALLIVNKPNLAKLNFAPASPALTVGDRVYAVSGLGGTPSGSISQGYVDGLASNLIIDDAQVGSADQGGPLLNANGDVIGIQSLNYHPLNFSSTGVYFTVPVARACNRVLRCPGGTIGGVGAQGGG